MSSSWMWFQATAIGPVAAGAAIGSTCPTASGRASATSSATIPPSEPPVTSASRSMPSASSSAHRARAWSRVEIGRERGAVRPAGRAGRRDVGPVVP